MRSSLGYAIALICLFGLINQNEAQPGTCGGACTFSEDCMLDSGDTSCRCSYFHCKRIEEGTCGGGCITNEQCRSFSGDANCKCSILFECELQSRMEEPGYQTYARFIQLTKGKELKRKQEKLMMMQKAN